MWLNPIPYDLVPTHDSDSFADMEENQTGLPLTPHVGAFGVQRANHIHEGIDLYCPEGTPVRAMESGVVVAVEKFTGPSATPPSDWWNDTEACLIEGPSGVIVYGEITCTKEVDDVIETGDLLGYVVEVLKVDKGRPMSMLHIELHTSGTLETAEWIDEKPASLLDPTPFLVSDYIGE